MKLINPRIETLKQLMALEEKRSSLQQELDALVQNLTQLQGQLLQNGTPAPVKASGRPPLAAKAKTPAEAKTPAKPRTKKTSTRRGELRDKVRAALEAAGNTGVFVKELAAALGTKPVNVHSWFHSALKNANSGIQKITGGHYRLLSSTATSPAAKSAKSPVEAKAAKPNSKAKAKGKGKGVKRGELTTNILAGLKAAGDKGVSVSDLATQLGAKYKNIYIWFATTGKKQPGLKKVGPARYKLA